MFKVQLVSWGGCVRRDYCGGLTEQEAIEFCEENNWEYTDENEFVWDLDYIIDWNTLV